MSTGNKGPESQPDSAVVPTASLDHTDVTDAELESVAGGAVDCVVGSNQTKGINGGPNIAFVP